MIEVKEFFDKSTCTFTYIVYHKETNDAVIIDPVWDFDLQNLKTFQTSIKKYMQFIDDNNLKIHILLDTHPHADHFSALSKLKTLFNCQTAISKNVIDVQKNVMTMLNCNNFGATDGSQFDMLLHDKQVIHAGEIAIEALSTPGHTPACMSFKINDMIFTGDLIFMPDVGTGRCDFPGGSAQNMFDSIKKLYEFPDDTIIYIGHDYPNNRQELCQTSVLDSKKNNIMLSEQITKEDFLSKRKAKDATLSLPRLIYPSIQINVNAGQIPHPESNGKSYIKLPLL